MTSVREAKDEHTASMARKITEAEKVSQDAKTARLREARLARDAEEPPTPMKKLKPKKQ
jgi:hypothetical protein